MSSCAWNECDIRAFFLGDFHFFTRNYGDSHFTASWTEKGSNLNATSNASTAVG